MSIRIAYKDAKIGFVFARRGLVMEACSSFFLPKLIGYVVASSFYVSSSCCGPFAYLKDEAGADTGIVIREPYISSLLAPRTQLHILFWAISSAKRWTHLKRFFHEL